MKNQTLFIIAEICEQKLYCIKAGWLQKLNWKMNRERPRLYMKERKMEMHKTRTIMS